MEGIYTGYAEILLMAGLEILIGSTKTQKIRTERAALLTNAEKHHRGVHILI